MKIKITKEFSDGTITISEGTVLNVLRKKEPDKWNNYVRYVVNYVVPRSHPILINIPEEYAQEV